MSRRTRNRMSWRHLAMSSRPLRRSGRAKTFFVLSPKAALAPAQVAAPDQPSRTDVPRTFAECRRLMRRAKLELTCSIRSASGPPAIALTDNGLDAANTPETGVYTLTLTRRGAPLKIRSRISYSKRPAAADRAKAADRG